MKFLSFVEEAVNQNVKPGCIGGRIEVRELGAPHANKEIRFLTSKQEEFWQFRETWDFLYVSPRWLDWIEGKVEDEFQDCYS